MPFLGVSPTQEFTSVAKQTITGDGSTSYTLNKGVSTENDLAVFVNDVRQEPGVAYTASANTITFTANLESTDSCYVLHIGRTFSSAESPGIDDNATSKVVTIQSDGHIVPTANVTYDLGTSDLRFRDLYLSGSSLHLGTHDITANATHVSMGNVATTGVMSGNAALMTSLNADELTSGTLPLARLPNDVTIVNDLTIGGDLVVNGNTTTIAANELKVEDSLIQLATNNEISDTIDIGFVGHYSNDGNTALHTGFFRDASNEYYYLFNGYEEAAFDTATPPSTIDRTANTFTLANFVANNVGMGSDPFLSNNYSTLNIRSTAGGQLLMGRDSGTNDWDFFAYSASTHTAIGTAANTYFTFHTDSTGASNERMRIDKDGNVGIGESAPDTRLEVAANGPSNSFSPAVKITEQGVDAYGGEIGARFVASSNKQGLYVEGYNSLTLKADTTAIDFIVGAGSAASDTDLKMRIDSSGNVGIGVDSPAKRLDVYAAAPSGGIIAKIAGGTSGGWVQIADSNGSWQIGSTSRGLEFYSDSTSAYRMALSPSGNLGIGTATPRSTLDLGADSTGGTQISWHSSSTRSLGNIWTSNNGGRLTFGQALKGSTTTNNGYLGAYTGTWAPTAMELSYGVINLFADAAQSLTYGGAFTPTQVAKFHNSSGFTSYKTIRTEFAGNTEHLALYNTGASKWSFYSYNDGHMYINCLPSGGSDATRFTIKSDGSVGIGTAAPAKLLHVVTNGGFRLTDSANYSHIHIGSPDLYVRYPYYRIDSFKTDGTGYFWAFAHHNATSGAKSINMMISDGTNPYGFFKNNLYVGTFTSNEYTGSYPAIATPAAIRGTANSTSYIGGDGTGHFAVGTNSVKTGVTAAGVVTSALGPLIHGKTQGSYASTEPRCILGWYTYAGPSSNSGSYLHMKTNLWAGSGSNTEFTMSLFRYRGYCYTGSPNSVGQGMVGWHNWNGTLYNMTVHNDTSWSIAQSSYVSSDGYCVLVAYMPAAYAQIIIDWDQWGGYDFRERRVTASTQSSSSTGAY